jgi:hypothetical protein
MLCPLTGLFCLACCGGFSDGDRCPVAPPYRNPLAGSGLPDWGAVYPGRAGTPEERALALAQLAEQGAFTAQAGAGTGLISHAFLMLRVIRIEALQRGVVGLTAAGSTEAELVRRYADQMAEAIAEEQRLALQRLQARREAEEARERALMEAWKREQAERKAAQRRLVTPEIVIGERIGWRIWWYRYRHYRLHSFAVDVWWEPGGCIMEGKPGVRDYAGLWAFKERDAAFDKACAAAEDAIKSAKRRVRDGWRPIWGAVALWGDMFEHEIGWRAEKARILSLDGILVPHPRTRRNRSRFYRDYRLELEGLRRAYRVGSWRDHTISLRPNLAGVRKYSELTD